MAAGPIFPRWIPMLYLCLLLPAVVLWVLLTDSQAQITLDGSVGSSGPLTGPDYTIPAEVGQQLGGNLFHSFGDFNVNTGESATFTGPGSVSNIIGRVTGGNPSTIDGLLRSDIAEANLFLLNPQGVMFGPNASLEVSDTLLITGTDPIDNTPSGIFASTSGGGKGGDMTVNARQVQLAEGARLQARSTRTGNAGDITITVQDTFRSENSAIRTDAAQSDGGALPGSHVGRGQGLSPPHRG